MMMMPTKNLFSLPHDCIQRAVKCQSTKLEAYQKGCVTYKSETETVLTR